jgi:hypothetical protein
MNRERFARGLRTSPMSPIQKGNIMNETRIQRAARRRQEHARLSAHQCAIAYLSPLAVCVEPGDRIEDVDLYAVQVGHCRVHGVEFAELYRGNDREKAQRIISEHNARRSRAGGDLPMPR